MNIGIYGGTFDPPHIGHAEAVRQAAAALSFDRLLLMPCCVPPHKELSGASAPAEDRLEMVRLTAAEIPGAEASDLELKRGGASYTVDTLEELQRLYPGASLTLLMGTDMFLYLKKWKDWETILKRARIAVFPRAEGERDGILRFARQLTKETGAEITALENRPVEVSSSELRELLPKREGRALVTGPVYDYLIRKRLYGAKPEYAWLREKAYAMLNPKRVPHVAGCEQEAVKLANRWGADAEEAREAGILHDITKKETLEEQLRLCAKYGIMLDNVEKNEAKLLHSKTGAAVARDLFGVSDEVYGAIFWHTTGRRDMTLLEEVIYMADYIEPTRHFDGVDKLRALAYEDLDRAMVLGYEMSIEDMTARGIVPHARTQEALDWAKKRLEERENKTARGTESK